MPTLPSRPPSVAGATQRPTPSPTLTPASIASACAMAAGRIRRPLLSRAPPSVSTLRARSDSSTALHLRVRRMECPRIPHPDARAVPRSTRITLITMASSLCLRLRRARAALARTRRSLVFCMFTRALELRVDRRRDQRRVLGTPCPFRRHRKRPRRLRLSTHLSPRRPDGPHRRAQSTLTGSYLDRRPSGLPCPTVYRLDHPSSRRPRV